MPDSRSPGNKTLRQSGASPTLDAESPKESEYLPMITKAGVRAMMGTNPKIRPSDCVLRGHCRTRVFEFPKVELSAEEPMQPRVILEKPGARATVVSDILEYFRKDSPFRHYAICCSLRWKISDAVSRRGKDSTTGRFPLFVVVEQDEECETALEDGLCYVVDQEMITGGCAGRTALVAWRTDDAPWPQVVEEPGFDITVLAAVKIVQDETEVIREVAEASCFYDANGCAVYPMTATMNANATVISPLTATEVADRLARVRMLVQVFEAEQRGGDTRIRDLVEALKLSKIDTDHYRRAWYLCLFEAIEAALSNRHKHEFHQRHRGYRKTIGHPRPSTSMDMYEFVRMQRDALAELRRIFLGD